MRKKRMQLFFVAFLLIVLLLVGYMIFCFTYCIDSVVKIAVEDIDHVLIGYYPSVRDDTTLWTCVTTPSVIQALYDTVQNTKFAPPHERVDFPTGTMPCTILYGLKDGTEIEMQFWSSYTFGYMGTYYEFADPFHNDLHNLSTLLANYEFVPYVDLALQGYFPLHVGDLVPVSLEEIKCILVEKPVGDESLLPDYVRQWAAITAEDHTTPIFNALQTTELIPVPLNSSDYPTGGTTQQIIYQLKDGTEIQFLLYDKSILRVGDTDFKYRSSSNNDSPSLRSVLKTMLRQYEFAPLE